MDPLLVLTVDLAMALLFMAGAAEKSFQFSKFRSIVGDYQLVSQPLISFVAGLVLTLEVMAGVVALLAALTSRASALLLLPAALIFFYAGAMAINLMRGRSYIDCGCIGFGAVRPSISWALVIRNIVIGGVALLVSLVPAVVRPLGPIDLISCIGALVILPLLYLGFEQYLSIESFGKEVES